MSRLITNSIRSTAASADAITLDGSGNATFPANVTCSGTAAGFGGGKILQVVTATTSTQVSNNSTNYASSGLAASITPSATSSKIFITTSLAINMNGVGVASSGRQCVLRLCRGDHTGTALSTVRVGMSAGTSHATAPEFNDMGAFAYLDSPNTTSSTTYTVAMAKHDDEVIIYAQLGGNYTSSMTLFEVGA